MNNEKLIEAIDDAITALGIAIENLRRLAEENRNGR